MTANGSNKAATHQFYWALGLILQLWSQFEILIEIIYMRETAKPAQDVSDEFRKLEFGGKWQRLKMVLATQPDKQEMIETINLIVEMIGRNDLVHGFFVHRPYAENFRHVIRPKHGPYHVEVEEIQGIDLFERAKAALVGIETVQCWFEVSDEDIGNYTTEIEGHQSFGASAKIS